MRHPLPRRHHARPPPRPLHLRRPRRKEPSVLGQQGRRRGLRMLGYPAAAGPAGFRAPGPAATFVQTVTGLRGPARTRGGSLAETGPLGAKSAPVGPVRPSGATLPSPGSSLPCLRRPGRPEPGLVTYLRQMPATCGGLCRLQTARRSSCELVQMGKTRQEVAGLGFELLFLKVK